ncbi:unnamed protein product [Lymnaea stagnalis]|uniref:Uncharacterized protein n=1 Tax=Lymnaea stagnalis TaxID=6523 RepID=A0AAV2IK99_LYMST
MDEELDELYSDVFQIPGGVSVKSQVSPKKRKNLSNGVRISHGFDECSVDIYSDLSMDSVIHTEKNYKTSPLKLKPFCTLNKPEGNGELEKNIECLDLYTELLTSELTEKEKTNHRVRELEKVNQELLEENKMLKQLKEQLSKNISSLFLTAKKEMEKKEAEITKLKKIIEEHVTAQQRDSTPNATFKSTKVNAENNDRKYISSDRCKTSSIPDNKPDLAVTREAIFSARRSPLKHEGNKNKISLISADKSHRDSDKVKVQTFPPKEAKGVERNDSDHSNTDLRLMLKSRQQESPGIFPQNKQKEEETSRKIILQHNRSKEDEPKAVKMPGSECLIRRPSHKQNNEGITPTKEILAASKKQLESVSPSTKKRRLSVSDKKPHSEIRDRLQQEINQSYSLAACKGVAARRKLKDSSSNDVSKDASTHHFASPGKLKSIDRLQQFSSDKKNPEMVVKAKEGSGLNSKFHGSSLEVPNVKVSNFDKKTSEKNCVAPRPQVKLNRGSELTVNHNNFSYNTKITPSLTNSLNLQTHSLNCVGNSSKSSPKYSDQNLKSANQKVSTPLKKSCNTATTRKNEMVSADHESNSVTQPFSLLKEDISNPAKDLALTNQTWSFEHVACSSSDKKGFHTKDSIHAAPQNKTIRAFPIVEMTVTPTAAKSPSLSSSFVDIESISDEQDEIETNRNDNKSHSIEARHGNRVHCNNFHMNNDASKLLPEKHATNIEIDLVSINDEDTDDSETDLDPKNLFEPKPDRSEKMYKAIAKSDNSNDSDKTSIGSSAASTDTDKQSSNDELTSSNQHAVPKIECSLASSPTRYVTSITCTSNLILLGDEETTCTTFISPSKPHLLPSEFYPPGVRGQVSDKSFHVRHIRGQPEVIHKSNNGSPKNEELKQSRVPHSEDMVVEENSTCKKQLPTSTDEPSPLINAENKTTKIINGDHLKNIGELQYSQDSIHEVTAIISTGNFEGLKTLEAKTDDLESSGCDRQLWMNAVQKTFQKVFQNELQSFKDGNVIYSKPLRKFNSNRYELYKKRLNLLRKAKPASLPRKVLLMKQPILKGQQQIFEGSRLLGSSPLKRNPCSPNIPNLSKSDNALPATNQPKSLTVWDPLNEKCNDLRETDYVPLLVDNDQTAHDTCIVTSSDHSLVSVKSSESCTDKNKMSHYEPDSTSDSRSGIKHKSQDFLVTNKAEVTSDKSIPLKNDKTSLKKDKSDSRVNDASHHVTSVKSSISLTDQLYLSDDDTDIEDNFKFKEDIISTKENSKAFTNLKDDITEDKALNRKLLKSPPDNNVHRVLLREDDGVGCLANATKPLRSGGQSMVRKCHSDIELILNTTFSVSDTEEDDLESRVDEDKNSLPKFNMDSQTVLAPDEISLMEVSLSEFDSDVAQARKGTPVKNIKSHQQNVYVSPLSFKNKIMPHHIVTEHQNPKFQDELKETLQATARPSKMSIDDVSKKLLSQKLKDLDQQTAHTSTSSDKTVGKNSQQFSLDGGEKLLKENQPCYVLLSRIMTFEELKRNKLVKNRYVYTESDTDERSDTADDHTEADGTSLPEGRSNVKLSSDQKEFIQKISKVKKKLDLDFVKDGHSKTPESLPFQSPILQVSDSMLSPPVKQVAGEDVLDLSKVKTEYQSSPNCSLNVSTDERKLEKIPIIKALFTDNKGNKNGEALTGCFSNSVKNQIPNTEAVRNSNTKQYLKGSKLCPEYVPVLKSKSADIEDGEIFEENLACSSKQNSFINERDELEAVIKREFKKPQKMNVKQSDLTHSSSPELTHSSHRSNSYLTDCAFSDRGRKRSRSPSPNQRSSSRPVKHPRKSSPRLSRVSSREDIYRSRQRCRDGKDVTNEIFKGWVTDSINPEKKTSYSNFSRDRSPQKRGQRSYSNRSRQLARERMAGEDTSRYFGQKKNSPTRSHERNEEKNSYRGNRKIFDRALSPKEQDKLKSSRLQSNHRGYQRRSPSNYCSNKEKTASLQRISPPKHSNDKNFCESHFKNQRSKYSEEENQKPHSSKESWKNFREVSPKREISENELTSRGKYESSIGSQFGISSSLKYIKSEVPGSQYEDESPMLDNVEEGELSE